MTKITKARREGISEYVYRRLLNLMDSREADALTEKMMPAIIKDIKETTDWTDYNDDVYCYGDIDIALKRVLLKRFRVEV